MTNAEQTLRDLLDKILDDRGYRPREIEVKDIATDGASYTSNLFVVNVSSPNRDDLKLFAKVACIGGVMRERMHADWLYKTERLVYNQLVKIYEEIQEETQVLKEHKFMFPEFYGYIEEEGKETVVMENLFETGFKSFDRLKPFDWECASVAVENLAKFHALSFAFEKYRPEEYRALTSDMKYEICNAIDKQNKNMIPLFTNNIEDVIEVVKEEHRERVKDFVMKNNLWDKFNKPIGKPVLTHGNYRMSNLMFRRQGGSLQSIAVDYQTVHAGCPASDLLYFVVLGSDQRFRRLHYERLLDHYHASLLRALDRLAVEPGVYTRDKLDNDLKELLPYAVLLGLVILPLVTVDAESAPSVESDANVGSNAIKLNERYAQRFSELVDDCILWEAI